MEEKNQHQHHEHHHDHPCHDCHHQHHHEHGGLKTKIGLIIATVILLLGAVFIEKNCQLEIWQLLLVYLIPYLIIGHETLKEAGEGIVHGNLFNEHFLMTIATMGALCIGFFPGMEPEFTEAVFVMLFFQVGELFEGYAEGKSRESISHLMDIRPDVARVERRHDVMLSQEMMSPQEEIVSPQEVRVGEIIIVRPGEKVPLDGVILSGKTSLNTVALTGESVPRHLKEGDEILSGCINLTGTVRIRTTKNFGESTVSKIIDLVESADQNKSKSEAFITRFARIYTPIVVFAALALAFIPPFLGAIGILPTTFGMGGYWENLPLWLNRALIFLVVSCPCALVISVPLTFFGGIGGASRHGILIKGSNYVDALANIGVVVFDKTGTLTHGEVIIGDRYDGFESSESSDASMKVNKPIVVNDQVKEDSAEAIVRLKQLGVERTVMLTGDKEEVGKRIADQLHLDEYHAELLPTGKVEHVERLLGQKPQGKNLAFVGDGINDAPVLKRADVGIAMGALGSDAAIEAADVVLMDDKPSKLATAILIARRTLRIAHQNVCFAIGVKVAVLLLAAWGWGTMWMAVFADVGVTVLAVLNAMRALRGTDEK